MSNILPMRATLKASPGDVDRYGLYPGTNRSTSIAAATDEVVPCDSGLSPSDTFHTARSSTMSFEIATERNGRKLMSEEEVSDLVHNALRRARLATGGVAVEERPTRHASLSPRKTPFSTSPTKQAMRRPFSFDEQIFESYEPSHSTRRVILPIRYGNTGTSFGDNHEQYDDNLRPTLEKHMSNLSMEDSSESSYPPHDDRLSNADSGTSSADIPADGTANSSDAIIRRVEEEIANARRAAHEANRRLAGVVDILEPAPKGSGFPELVSTSFQKDLMSSSRYSSESSFREDPSRKMAPHSANKPSDDSFLFQQHKSSKQSEDRLAYMPFNVRSQKEAMLPDDRDEESDGGRSYEKESAVMMLTSSIIEQRSSIETVDSSTRAKVLLDEVLTGSTNDADDGPVFEIERPLELFDEPSFENPTNQSGHLFESQSFGKDSMGPSFDISINNPGQHNRPSLYSDDDDNANQESLEQLEEKKVLPLLRSFERGSMEPSFDLSIDNPGRHTRPLLYADCDDGGTSKSKEWEEKVASPTHGSTSFHPQLSAQGNIIMRLLAQNDKQRKDEPPANARAIAPEDVIDLTQVESDDISGKQRGNPDDIPPTSHPQFDDSSDEEPFEYKIPPEVSAPEVSASVEINTTHKDESLTVDSHEVIELHEGTNLGTLDNHSEVQIDEIQVDRTLSTPTFASNHSIEDDLLEHSADDNDAANLPIQIVSSLLEVADEQEQTIIIEEGIEILYESTLNEPEPELEEASSNQNEDEHQVTEEKNQGEGNCAVIHERKSEYADASRESFDDEDVDLVEATVSSGEANAGDPTSDDKLETQQDAAGGDDDNTASVGLSVSVVSIESIVPSTTDENMNDIHLAEAGETFILVENPAGDATLDFLDEPRQDPSEIEDDAITAVVANGKPGPIVYDRDPEFEKILDTAESDAEATSESTCPTEAISSYYERVETKQQQLQKAADEEKETTVAVARPRKVRFKQRYPVPPLFKKSRAPDAIVREHQVAHTANIPFLAKPKSDLRQLMDAAVGAALQRRSNACGALKVLTTQKKNKLMLVRTAGFLDALVFAAAADVPRKPAESAVVARTRAVTAIFNVSEPKDNREIVFCHHGLIPALIKTIMDDTGEARMVACAALAILAKTVSNREPMAAAEGLIAALVMLLVKNRTDLDLAEAHTGTFSSDDNSDQDSSCRRSYSSNSESSSSSVDHSSSDSQDEEYEVAASAIPRAKSMRQKEREARNETIRRSQSNACATLLQLSKQCGAAAIMGQSDALLRALVKLSRQTDDPMHTKCIEILCNLTRFPANNEVMSQFPGLVDSLVINGGSTDDMDRIWSLRVLQNLSSHVEGKTVLANQVVLELLSFSIMRETVEEQLAATATLYNLSTEPGAVVPLTNSKNVVATLVHVAHNPESSSEVRLMACDALATLGLWLQTLAGAGTFPEDIDPNTTLPSYGTTGWNRWD